MCLSVLNDYNTRWSTCTRAEVFFAFKRQMFYYINRMDRRVYTVRTIVTISQVF